jgi:hypothetical protein
MARSGRDAVTVTVALVPVPAGVSFPPVVGLAVDPDRKR